MNDNQEDDIAPWRKIGDVLPDLMDDFSKPYATPAHCSFCDRPSEHGVRSLFASTAAKSMICSQCVEWLAREIQQARRLTAMPALRREENSF